MTDNETKDLVSVVIPTHNRPDMLIKAINSVNNQTYKTFEIIVIDDSSDKRTETALKDRKIEGISYFKNEEPKGANYSRNLGVRHSKGEFVAFLDDDDEWLPRKLEKQIELMRNNRETGLVYTGSKILYDTGFSYSNIPKSEGDLSKLIYFNNIIGTTSTVMVRRSVFSKSGLFDESLPGQQDFDLWIRICAVTKAACVKEELILYNNISDSGQISSDVTRHHTAFDLILKKYSEKINSFTQRERRKIKSYYSIVIAKKYHRTGRNLKAVKYGLRAFTYDPKLKTLIFILLGFFDFSISLRLRKKFSFL
jgi:glycosyltransferase involved in cell wall biosynthesis